MEQQQQADNNTENDKNFQKEKKSILMDEKDQLQVDFKQKLDESQLVPQNNNSQQQEKKLANQVVDSYSQLTKENQDSKQPDQPEVDQHVNCVSQQEEKFPEQITSQIQASISGEESKEETELQIDAEDLLLQMQNSLNVNELYQKSNQLKQLCQFEDALDYINKATSIDPSFIEGHLLKGLLFMNIQRYDDSQNCFYCCLNQQAKNKKQVIAQSIALILMSQDDEAEQLLEKSIKEEPSFLNDKKTLKYCLENYVQVGKINLAVRCWGHYLQVAGLKEEEQQENEFKHLFVEQMTPEIDLQVVARVHQIYQLKQEKEMQMMKLEQDLAKARIQFQQCQMCLLNSLLAQQSYWEYFQKVQEYVSQFPQDSEDIILEAAQIYFNLGMMPQQIELLKTILPNQLQLYKRAQLCIAVSYFLVNQIPQAISTLEQLDQLISQPDPQLLYTKGFFFHLMGQRNEAIQCYNSSLQLNDQNAKIYRNLAMIQSNDQEECQKQTLLKGIQLRNNNQDKDMDIFDTEELLLLRMLGWSQIHNQQLKDLQLTLQTFQLDENNFNNQAQLIHEFIRKVQLFYKIQLLTTINKIVPNCQQVVQEYNNTMCQIIIYCFQLKGLVKFPQSMIVEKNVYIQEKYRQDAQTCIDFFKFCIINQQQFFSDASEGVAQWLENCDQEILAFLICQSMKYSFFQQTQENFFDLSVLSEYRRYLFEHFEELLAKQPAQTQKEHFSDQLNIFINFFSLEISASLPSEVTTKNVISFNHKVHSFDKSLIQSFDKSWAAMQHPFAYQSSLTITEEMALAVVRQVPVWRIPHQFFSSLKFYDIFLLSALQQLLIVLMNNPSNTVQIVQEMISIILLNNHTTDQYVLATQVLASSVLNGFSQPLLLNYIYDTQTNTLIKKGTSQDDTYLLNQIIEYLEIQHFPNECTPLVNALYSTFLRMDYQQQAWTQQVQLSFPYQKCMFFKFEDKHLQNLLHVSNYKVQLQIFSNFLQYDNSYTNQVIDFIFDYYLSKCYQEEEPQAQEQIQQFNLSKIYIFSEVLASLLENLLNCKYETGEGNNFIKEKQQLISLQAQQIVNKILSQENLINFIKTDVYESVLNQIKEQAYQQLQMQQQQQLQEQVQEEQITFSKINKTLFTLKLEKGFVQQFLTIMNFAYILNFSLFDYQNFQNNIKVLRRKDRNKICYPKIDIDCQELQNEGSKNPQNSLQAFENSARTSDEDIFNILLQIDELKKKNLTQGTLEFCIQVLDVFGIYFVESEKIYYRLLCLFQNILAPSLLFSMVKSYIQGSQYFRSIKLIKLHIQRGREWESLCEALKNVTDNELLSACIKIMYSNQQNDPNLPENVKHEPAEDYGGLTRDMYVKVGELVFNNRINPLTGQTLDLFSVGNCQTQSVFPNPHRNPQSSNQPLSINDNQMYELAGKICAKAMLDEQTLCTHFSLFFLKLVLGRGFNFTDVKEYDDQVYKQLKFLLVNNNVEEIGQNFEVIKDKENYEELKTNGKHIKVNDSNKLEFVALFCQYKLEKVISEQIDSFRIGFFKIIPMEVMALLDPVLLQSFFVGSKEIDIPYLKSKMIYSNVNKDSEIIQWFWKIFEGWSETYKVQFIKALTGFPCIPAQGYPIRNQFTMKDDYPTINVNKELNQDLPPEYHNCFSLMVIPQYDTYELFKVQMEESIVEENSNYTMI